MSVFVHHVSKY